MTSASLCATRAAASFPSTTRRCGQGCGGMSKG
jgi:hypothetical protein